MPRLVAALLVSFTIALAIACDDSRDDPVAPETITGGQPMLRTLDVQLADDTTIVVEVADDADERTQGLSGRSGLGEGTGMLFVWEEETQHTLWMKDMLFGLDMAWLDASRTVVSIDANLPTQPGASTSDLVQYHPVGAAKYAIELAAGQAKALDIEVGDVLEFEEGSD